MFRTIIHMWAITLKEEQELFLTIRNLLSEQKLGALATHGQGETWASLIAFAATDNLDSIYFATPKTTRKYSNLVNDPRCSLLIDNRENLASDKKLIFIVHPIDLDSFLQHRYVSFFSPREFYQTFLPAYPAVGFSKRNPCAHA